MQTPVPPKSEKNFLQLVAVVVSAVLIASCTADPESNQPEPSVAPRDEINSPPETSHANPFVLSVEPVDEDPKQVVVKVTAREQSAWASIKDESDREIYQSVLSLHLADETLGDTAKPVANQTEEQPTPLSILGRYTIESDKFQFRPAFPLSAGHRYVARFNPAALTNTESSSQTVLQLEYLVPAIKGEEKPHIVSIFPSGSILPSNHLKFYIQFSEPMQQGDIFKYFRLENRTAGEAVPRPFRHTELWSPDDLRLTLWFHPGRQKPGVNLNVEIGPVLTEDNEYTLIISGDWKSLKGSPLGEDFEKSFRAGGFDNRQPDPENWICSVPLAGTREIFRCELLEPLDGALLLSRVHIENASGKEVPGQIELGYGEMSWNFEPKSPWKAGVYRMAIAKVLEDLAGNSIERPFNLDITKPIKQPKKPVAKTVYRKFVVAGDIDQP